MRLSAVWLLAVAALPLSAQGKQSVSLHISEPVKVGSTVLKAGDYNFQWTASAGATDVTIKGQSSNVTLKAQAGNVTYGYQSVETAGDGADKKLVGFVAKHVEFRFDTANVASAQ